MWAIPRKGEEYLGINTFQAKLLILLSDGLSLGFPVMELR